jgi:hypothetical protein
MAGGDPGQPCHDGRKHSLINSVNAEMPPHATLVTSQLLV